MEILIGFVSGIITSIGMGGGTVLILLLTICFNIPQNIAQATNLIFFIPTSIVSIILNYKNRNIDFKLSYSIIFFGIIGAIVGASIVNKIETVYLRKMFGVFLILVALYEVYLLVFNKKKK